MVDEGKSNRLVSAFKGLVDKHVKQRGRDTIADNAEIDPAEPLAQRVTESSACEFCLSRENDEPVTPSKVSRDFHKFCRCHFMLLFQKTKLGKSIASDEALESVGVTIEEGADPDPFEKRDALILATMGHRVKLLKRHLGGERKRMADALVDGELVEFKNPTGAGKYTVSHQIQKNLHGRNKEVLNPQSDVLLVSNARNSMTMAEMQESLAFAFSEDSILTAEEKAYMRKIILLDEKTKKVRVYELKMPAEHGTKGHGHRQANISTSKASGQAAGDTE